MPSNDSWLTLPKFVQALDAVKQAPRELSYDAALVQQVAPEDRAEAKAEILRRVAAGDVLAFETAAALGLQEAVPSLVVERRRGSTFHRGAAERALFTLRGDPLPTAARGDPIARGLDAFALKQSTRPEAIPGLIAALADPGVHARVHASEGLVEKLGLAAIAAPRGSPLRTMMLGVCGSLPTVWPVAAEALRATFEAIRAGSTPESLDLVYRPSADPEVLARFWSEATGGKPFDVANIRAMGEHDRAFAEMVLVARLTSRDVNVLPALKALAVPGWPAHARAALALFGAKHLDIAAIYRAAAESWLTLAAFVEALDAVRAPGEQSYDAALVQQVAPEDRAEANAEIVRRVAAGDVLAFGTAAALGLQEAVPSLVAARLGGGSTPSRGVAERALFALRGDPLPTAAREDPVARGLDALALKQSTRPEAIPALIALLADPGVYARIHASQGLVEKLGLAAIAVPRGSPLRTLLLGVCDSLPTVWPVAAEALRATFEAVRGGASAQSLDLVYRPSADPEVLARFWGQASARKPFDVANIRAMGEHDRAFAEMVLVGRLTGPDVNVLPVLKALAVPGWEAHVRAALPLFEARHPEAAAAYRAALASADA